MLASLFSYNVGDKNVMLPVKVHSAGGYLLITSGCWLTMGFLDAAGLGSGVAEITGVAEALMLTSGSRDPSLEILKNQIRPIPAARASTQIVICLFILHSSVINAL